MEGSPFQWQEEATERFNHRSAWVDFVNLAARTPQLDFRNQLLLAHQVRERETNVRAFASFPVWRKFGYELVPGSEPFLLRGSPGVVAKAEHRPPTKQDYAGMMPVYERWQVEGKRGRGEGVPEALTASHIAKTSPDSLSDRLGAWADQRGLPIIETEPKYLPAQAAALRHSRAENKTRVLLRKDITETQRTRGLIGVLVADMVGRLPSIRPDAGSQGLNPFVTSGIRHIVESANGLTDKQYRGAPKVPWPTTADTNTVYRWGEVTSLASNVFLAATSAQPQRILDSTSTFVISRDLYRAAHRHAALEGSRARQQGQFAEHPSPTGQTKFSALMDSRWSSLGEGLARYSSSPRDQQEVPRNLRPSQGQSHEGGPAL